VARTIFGVMVLAFVGFGSAAFSAEPTKTNQYLIELRVCHGDPLGSKADGNLDILSHPTIITVEGEAAQCMIGQKLTGIDADSPDFAGVSLKVRPVGQKDGAIHMEIGCKVSEVVEESEFHIETRVVCARRTLNVNMGETFKMRMKGQSATDQTWLEGKVTEIKEVDRDKNRKSP
jgi:hypothetical protein